MTTVVVVHATGLATVQDLGRPGRMHEAVPPGGALVPELLVAANRRARNRDDAPAIEVLGRLVVRAEATIAIATDRGDGCVLASGDEHVVASEPRRVAYLAVRGGVDAPLVLGGRGTLLCAELGAPLRAGDRIASAGAPEPARVASPPPFDERDADRALRVVPGPDRDAFAADALAALASAPYRVLAASDRVGTRLAGPHVARAAAYTDRSRPMLCGAIEVPGDGQPIVLGPEHPTTGGYPIVAVICHADVGRMFAIRPGGAVRFVARS